MALLPITFTPKSVRSYLVRLWLLVIFAALLIGFVLPRYEPELASLRWVMGLAILLWTLFFRQPVSVVIIPELRILDYTYANAWGSKQTVRIDLSTASGYYEQEQAGKGDPVWKLVLYNGSYWGKRVSLKEDNAGGFSKAQLDDIVRWVHQYKGK